MGAGASLSRIDWRTRICVAEMTTPRQHMAQKIPYLSSSSNIIHSEAPYSPHPIFPLLHCTDYSVHSHVNACRELNFDLHPYSVLSPPSSEEQCQDLLVIIRSGMLPAPSFSAILTMVVHLQYISDFQLARSLAEFASRSTSHSCLSRRIAAVCSKSL